MMTATYETYRRTTSKTMYWLSVACAAAIIGILALVTIYLASIGLGHLSWDFFTQVPTGQVENPGGMKHAIVGTGILVLLASILGVPMGMLAGVYLSEYKSEKTLVTMIRFVADVLTGVPSIVVGILGYELLVVPMGGYSGWAGAFALAFIMVPIVARTTEEMLRLVPKSYREGSLALGATKSQTILRVILPAATGSIVTGIMLALARVAGETAPLLFTALGSRFLELNPSQPFPSLTVQIYTYATGPYQALKNQAWAGILVLIGLIFLLNLGIRFFASRTTRGVAQ
jgi:phosphate transport system permease protein